MGFLGQHLRRSGYLSLYLNKKYSKVQLNAMSAHTERVGGDRNCIPNF
jgi:hypothetical protein